MKKECTAWQLRLSNTLCYRLKQILMESFFNVLLWYIQRKNIISFTSNQITQMTHTLHPEIEKTIQRLVNRIKQDVVTWKEDDVYWLIIWYLWPYLLPPSQHLKDEQFVEQFEKYCEEELKQSTPKIEKIELTKDDDYWGDTHKKLNEIIDYINNSLPTR